MINAIHAWLHRPEKGWDPVPAAHAAKYAQTEWDNLDIALVDKLEGRVQGFAGKRILDLGGGPGQYSAAFAARGAEVTWHDVSRNYLDIARGKCREKGLNVEFSLGYLEDARKFTSCPFDFVFNRICWYYCMNDRYFAGIVHSIVKSGGACYIDCLTAEGARQRFPRSIFSNLNRITGIKIGHPFPNHGGLAKWFLRYPNQSMLVEYDNKHSDKIFFVKS